MVGNRPYKITKLLHQFRTVGQDIEAGSREVISVDLALDIGAALIWIRTVLHYKATAAIR